MKTKKPIIIYPWRTVGTGILEIKNVSNKPVKIKKIDYTVNYDPQRTSHTQINKKT